MSGNPQCWSGEHDAASEELRTQYTSKIEILEWDNFKMKSFELKTCQFRFYKKFDEILWAL
jgi:hypothetical protein